MSAFEKLFGRTYNSIGNSDADFIIKTRGQVKVQWGKKYIDLIKNGKLNVDVDFIKRVKTEANMSQDGIYVIEDTGNIVLKVGNTIINLSADTEGSYVSFIIDQTATEEQKIRAQTNIGLRYKSMADAVKAGVVNGIVFLDDSQKWYIVSNGNYSVYSQEIQNPYPNQFRIAKTDSDVGSLVIEGLGSTNSLVLGSDSNLGMIYKEASSLVISNTDDVVIRISDNDVITVGRYSNTISNDTTFNGIVTSNTFQSVGATPSNGFRLYVQNGESFLEVDNLILRNGTNATSLSYEELLTHIEDRDLTPFSQYIINDYQNEWELTTDEDVIPEDIQAADEDGNKLWEDEDETIPVIETYKNVRPLVVTASGVDSLQEDAYFYDNQYWKVKYDVSYRDKVRVPEYDEETGDFVQMVEIPAKGRITKLTDEKGNSCNYDFKHLKFKIIENDEEKWVYTFRDGLKDLSLTDAVKDTKLEVNNPARASRLEDGTEIVASDGNYVWLSGTFDAVNLGIIASDFSYTGSMSKVRGYGTFTNVVMEGVTSIEDCEFHSLTNVKLYKPLKRAMFHDDFIDVDFLYDTYPLLYNNDKVKDVYYNDASVNVVCIPDIVFPGMIVMYNGLAPIPTGWHICDGTGGTPNLVGSFIKAGTSAGETGGSDEIQLTIDNMPAHSHTFGASSVTTSESGGHNHTFRGKYGASDNANDRAMLETGAENDTITTSWNGSHTHTIDMSKTVLSDTGKGEPLKWQPRYYSLVFIMRIG